MINMSNYLRLAAFISLILIILTLTAFTDLDTNVIISITLVMLFLIIFTYIFNANGSKTLKVLIILFIFSGLPIFLLAYLKISWLISPAVLFVGAISIMIIIRLDEAEIIH